MTLIYVKFSLKWPEDNRLYFGIWLSAHSISLIESLFRSCRFCAVVFSKQKQLFILFFLTFLTVWTKIPCRLELTHPVFSTEYVYCDIRLYLYFCLIFVFVTSLLWVEQFFQVAAITFNSSKHKVINSTYTTSCY